MAYTDPSTINMTDPMNLIYYINNNSFQLFGMGIIFVIWLLVLIGYYKGREDTIGALATSFFVAWVLSLLAWIGNLVSPVFFAIVTGITIIVVLLLFSDRGNS